MVKNDYCSMRLIFRPFFCNFEAVPAVIRCKVTKHFDTMQEKEQNISPVKRRILEFARSLGCSKRDFYKKIGVSRGTLESKTGITEDVLAKFIATFPEVSIKWLWSGEGPMYLSAMQENEQNNLIVDTGYYETRPRIPLDAAAGSLSLITQSVSEDECERFPVIKRFPQYDFTIIVKGDSMEPEFHSGDEIACRFIERPSFIQWGRPHVLDTHQGVVLKRIYNRSDSILCKSDNNEYDSFEIPKDEIIHIALVVGLIRLY